MVAAATASPPEAEARFVLTGVPWATYVALREVLEDSRVRITYLEGALELMSPSELREEEAKLIARLLEAWAEEHDVDLRGFKSATFRKEAGLRGAEPDECYSIGPKAEGDPPHLAIEIEASNPIVDKLAVYSGLGVAEVWVWRVAAPGLTIHVLMSGRYQPAASSRLLPGFDPLLFASFVRRGENQTALVKAYRAALRSTPRR